MSFPVKTVEFFLQKYSRFVIKTFRFHMFWVCYWICWVFHVRWSQLRIVYLSVRDQSWRILKFSAFSHLSFLKNCLSFFDSLSLFSLSFFKKWPKNKPGYINFYGRLGRLSIFQSFTSSSLSTVLYMYAYNVDPPVKSASLFLIWEMKLTANNDSCSVVAIALLC